MVLFIRNVPLYSATPAYAPAEWVLIKSLDPQPNGGVLVHGFNDEVLSVAVDGTWGWKPIDTADPTTVATLQQSGDGLFSGLITFNPSNGQKQPYTYPLVKSVV